MSPCLFILGMNICQFEEAVCNTDSEDCRPIYLNKWLVIPSQYTCSCKEGYQIHPIHKCIGLWWFYILWRIIYQLFWTQACPEGMSRTGLRSHARCHPYPIPQPVKVGHTTGVYDPYFFRIVMWVLLRATRTNQWKCCETGPTVFCPYARRPRKSNHLQMSLQRQHFLLSFSKDPECWSRRGLNPRPPARQTGALPTELTRRRLLNV